MLAPLFACLFLSLGYAAVFVSTGVGRQGVVFWAGYGPYFPVRFPLSVFSFLLFPFLVPFGSVDLLYVFFIFFGLLAHTCPLRVPRTTKLTQAAGR